MQRHMMQRLVRSHRQPPPAQQPFEQGPPIPRTAAADGLPWPSAALPGHAPTYAAPSRNLENWAGMNCATSFTLATGASGTTSSRSADSTAAMIRSPLRKYSTSVASGPKALRIVSSGKDAVAFPALSPAQAFRRAAMHACVLHGRDGLTLAAERALGADAVGSTSGRADCAVAKSLPLLLTWANAGAFS